MQKLFMIKNFDKTYKTHLKQMSSIEERMKELDISYHDILDSTAWVTIESQTHKEISINDRLRTKREIATIINTHTRVAISGSLNHYEMPKSWDTAFFLVHYNKTVEGMMAILENFIDRGEVK